MLSRRALIRSTGLLPGTFFMRGWAAEPVAPAGLKAILAQELPNARLLDISPDGTKLCLEDWKGPGYALRVLELGTWKTIYAGHLQQRALTVRFFADGQALFLDFAGSKGQLVRRQTVVDIRNGERMERMHAYDPFHYSEQMSPIDDRILLVAHYGFGPRYSMEWLSRVEFPSYRELARVELSSQQGDPQGIAGISVSNDRNLAAYFFNNAVVCRRTADLAVLWTDPIEAGLLALPSISDQGYVAADIAQGTMDGQFEHYSHLYIAVYDKAGVKIAHLPFGGAKGFALSPNGKLIAVVAEESGKKGEILPTIYIHDVSSGTMVASVVHDHISSGRRQFLLAGCSVVFTSDGRYLVTSGMVTKVWRIGE